MAISYVSFVNDVQSIPNFGSLSSWVRDKHGKTVQLEERWPWLILHLGTTDKEGKFTPSGERRRTPVHNIASISEDGEEHPTAVRGLDAAAPAKASKGAQS